MFNIFKKDRSKDEKKVDKENSTKEFQKNKKDISSLKEQKQKLREEKQKKKEENNKKRLEEEKQKAEQQKQEELEKERVLKEEQQKRQEEFEKRKAEKIKVEKKPKQKSYEEQDEDFELFGYKVVDLKQGMTITGKVLSETNDEYIVEVNDNFQEVIFPKNEKSTEINIGDEIKALIYRHSNDDFYISQRRLENVELLDKLKNMQKNEEVLRGKVIDFSDSNYEVELENGQKGLVYQVNIALEYVEDPQTQIGQTYDFTIKRVYPRGNYKFELTRIPLLKKKLEENVDLVQEDVEIIVPEFRKNKAGIEFEYEGFRIFIPYKLTGYEFVTEDSDMSSYVGKKAKIVECKKTKYGYNIVASIRALEKDPFEKFTSEYSEGDEVTGTVKRKEKYGLFLSLDHNQTGLYHKNDFSSELIKEFDDVEIGEKISAKIKTIDFEKKQIALTE